MSYPDDGISEGACFRVLNSQVFPVVYDAHRFPFVESHT